MAMDLTLPLRAVQLVFNIIVLGLIGYVSDYYEDNPSQVSFVLFTSIWTFFALAYLTLAPLYLAKLAHGFALLAVEVLTMLFWFAGFIALAVFASDHCPESSRACGTMKAAAAFAAFEWLLWTVTTVLVALKTFRSGASSTTKPGAAAGPTVAV